MRKLVLSNFLTFLLLILILPSSAETYAQNKISLDVQKESLKDVIKNIQNQTKLRFLYSSQDVENIIVKDVKIKNASLKDVLNIVLKDSKLVWEKEDNIIYIKLSSVISSQIPTIRVKGVVIDEDKNTLPGVSVVIKGTLLGAVTNKDGEYSILIPKERVVTLVYSFVGMQTVEILYKGQEEINITLKEKAVEIDDVIVTGIFKRKAESYTGASTTISSEDLKRVGNQNLLSSLKILDPSLYVMDNLDMGSDPNALPEMKIRGTTSFPTTSENSFKGNYANKPNQPLFILDGFETTVENVFDLDMNRVSTVTILKDASAKALYGSKAANGVVIIETKRLLGNKPKVTYVASLNIEAPDLSSYNLCNAEEKLQAELIEGVYSSGTFLNDKVDNLRLYNERKKTVADGLDTYWLSKPLRTGIGQKHHVSIEVGDSNNLRALIEFSYNNVAGVMKDSKRENIMGTANISYRVSKFIFRNIMSMTRNKSNESPYGTFSDYTVLNPYSRAYDTETGSVTRWVDDNTNTPNPMYDALIGTKYEQSYFNFINNFYAEWNINENYKLTGRLGLNLKSSDSDDFLPANHSSFSNYSYTSDELKLKKGSYTYESGKSESITFDLNLNYNKTIGKNSIFVNAGMSVSDKNTNAKRSVAIGFPSNMGADLNFARQYADEVTPQSFSTLQRELGFLAVAAYTYDNKYLCDFTYRLSASSLYGKDNRWSPGWSLGIGWNLHKEKFMSDLKFVKQFKLRSSIGLTGNQNFDTNNAITTFEYYTDRNYKGQVGSKMSGLANSSLKLEQRRDFDVGFDLKMYNLTAKFDYYVGNTKNMIADISTLTSTGFSSVKDNLGKVRNTGYELSLSYNVIQKKNGFFSVFASATAEENKIVKLSDVLKDYNETQMEIAEELGRSEPVLLYQDGQSMNTIWAVPSLGIDPVTGNEIYVKKDGTLTNEYSSLDLVAAGDKDPKYRGNFGFNTEYKGFGLSMTCSFLAGGEMYNSTLVDRVENIDIYQNVDKRVLQGRWQNPGDKTKFKKLQGINTVGDKKTQSTTRFVQNRDELNIASISAYYEFNNKILRKTLFKRLKLQFYMNDVAKFSSIKVERGLSYPFARNFSFSLTATF